MISEDVAKILLKVKAITLNPEKPYRFVSGVLSPIYCDNRLLMSYPQEREKITDFFIEIIERKNLKFDVLAGTATSGICWAAWVAGKMKKPMIYVRPSKKDHGKGNRIEGKLERGQKVLVIEDLVSTGGSSISAVEGVGEQGGIVDDCLAIFTYEMDKAKKGFKESGCNLITLTKFSTLIDVAVREGYIKPSDREKVLEWNRDPENWGKKIGFG